MGAIQISSNLPACLPAADLLPPACLPARPLACLPACLQVEGGFVQGMGWSCIEELVWGDKQHAWVRPGQLFTRGPGTYKVGWVGWVAGLLNGWLLLTSRRNFID